ncbi:MAG: FAD-dependent thymidylate synthase [Armatimonadota bacterium]|nr:FAD-dependent thymidylate synthase [Armatimonadota bacterium]MDR7518438.1 FAD-dependent thymidylate synthase [Armatimonadota bacterium]MDR7549550.1 FAD-dependent thymidylate synthase [Armatimonadota bacterium]
MYPQFASVDGTPSQRQRDIYLLSPRLLPPEVIAVAFAKTSRSPKPFREIAAELTEESSGAFHEKWVVGYGHASVAEHAVLHLALENLSRLAIECLESNRLCSYTEKSTRYQIFDTFYVPPAIAASPHADRYVATCRDLFETYQASLEPVRRVIEAWYPRRDDETDRAYHARIRSRYVDVCRFLLPCATVANVGMTANARALEHAITKMLSSPLEEVRAIGAEIRRVAQAEVPTLLKYAGPNRYLMETAGALEAAARDVMAVPDASWPWGSDPGGDESAGVRLAHYDRDAEIRLVAACLYRHGREPYARAWARAQAMSPSERLGIIEGALARLERHDSPIRELEHIAYTFDIVCDQGAYFDLKRHRMMTQSPQAPTVDLGYAVPRAVDEAGFGSRYRDAIERATAAYHTIARDFPREAAYLVTNAHNRRFLATMNLRELYTVVPLRARESGHFSYRRIALLLYEAVRAVHPALVAHIRFGDEPPSAADLQARFFSAVAARPEKVPGRAGR